MKYIKGDWKYRLYEPVTYATGIVNRGWFLRYCSISASGLLTIKPGYCWDGPSGPTFDTKSFMRGSLIHDALYQLLRETGFGDGLPHDSRRKRADKILRDVCLQDGMWAWRAAWVYRAVRNFASQSSAAKLRKVYEAP